ncbi:Enamine deaminase RidA, house cleaning of reactive enamine intermediates, YjgF/YER057c/UK114 family [Enhydrobacter aerosaccus]|uniref:Enamine deaminase RidA, house cleaning of reactive enamine intermediates, YjgF/YER057c/UK114 family n=1 Tax=Enhydrobacter aerosaccus TaxID=225324 RepID=A0A1T4JUW8_9HYPH|nr:RidA family protein [Enhydrobacter aerosaccus]SJZ33951.1 Enamine deaminase RidA, house cleaning of reactive enamine intermediates, YjgF/YER057c/UK114 family [Enhydrobacter aerosaccus]
MAIKFHNPKSVSFAGKYSLGAEVPDGARLLYVSGQVGVDAEGKLQPTFETQAAQVWKNIGQVLASAGMTYKDIVKATIFLTDSRFVVPYRDVRDQFITEAPYPASTLLVVAGLADPAMLIEVEVVAAKA